MFVDLAAFDDWLARWRALGPDAEAMDRVNPVYIPRNHLVEEALTAATDGDLDPLEQLLEAVTAPYDERPGLSAMPHPHPRTSVDTEPSAERDLRQFPSVIADRRSIVVFGACLLHELHARADTELVVDVGEVALHGARRDEKPGGDVLVRQPFGHQAHDVVLGRC